LAWEFIQHMIPVMTTFEPQYFPFRRTVGIHSLATPITRASFIPHVTAVMDIVTSPSSLNRLIPFVGLHDDRSHQQAVEDAIARLEAFNEMPTTLAISPFPYDLFFGDFFIQFMHGAVTPEETAQELHNRISLWMLE